ncbi:MAG: arylsulfatase [Cyclobacteriaceae bacterium]|nr:arylsulfatase [Cyclobacteriaceae bacterium]
MNSSLKKSLAILFLSTTLFLVLFSCKHQNDSERSNARPNIILIMSDDMGYSDIGCYGSEISTPNLDHLAANGLRFTQFYNTARCCPTRASLMTGLYPHQAGVGHMMNDRGLEGYAGNLSNKAVTIAEVLGSSGYNTYMCGKWHLTPGRNKENLDDKSNWPLQRGFQKFFGTIHGAGSFYDPNSLTSGNNSITPTANFYYTDAISDTAVKFIDQHANDNPFFMYVAYTAAHWPMHALPKDIAKYKGKYDDGWDAVRTKRYNKMIDMGLIKKDWPLSESYESPYTWEESELKAWHTQCMEVYAAMIDNMDQGIGRITESLKRNGEIDNTLIFFLQDNGACAEQYGMWRELPEDIDQWPLKPMKPGELQYNMVPEVTRDGRPLRIGREVVPGPADTYIGYDPMWANSSNTPFRMFKHWTHEGGIATPLIIHWPKAINAAGEFIDQPGQLIDIMATCVDVSGATYPEIVNDQSIYPMEGKSLIPTFDNEPLDREALYWEHEGNRAIRIGKWKLVSRPHKKPRDLDQIEELPLEEWELYDLDSDRTETNDLAGEYPEKVKDLSKQWMVWAARVLVIPKP